MHTIPSTRGLLARLFASGPLPAHGSGPIRFGGRALLWLLERLLSWEERANQRHQLRMMSDAGLKDIGISRADAEYEASKPFWRG